MARIKPAYSSRNFSPDRSQDVRACVVRVNGLNVFDVDFNFFEEYEADMPINILSGSFDDSTPGVYTDVFGMSYPNLNYTFVDLSEIDSVSGLSISDLDRYYWPRHRKPYGIHPIDFRNLESDANWFITGLNSGSVFSQLSDDLNYNSLEPQLNIVRVKATHLPSESFKNTVSNFFLNIPAQTSDPYIQYLSSSGSDQEFKSYLSGIGLTCGGSNYTGGSGYFSGYLNQSGYNSGAGFFQFKEQIVGSHVIFNRGAPVMHSLSQTFDADVGWFTLSNEEFEQPRESLSESSNFSGGFYIYYSGTGAY